MASSRNRLANTKNPYQGDFKKALCVCSAGLLRSPSIAHILSNPPYNYNVRAAGVEAEYALVPVDDALLLWADVIVCAEDWHKRTVIKMLKDNNYVDPTGEVIKEVIALNIPDNYETRSPKLLEIIQTKLEEINFEKSI